MSGWRCKIGLVIPSPNTTIEVEFRTWLPDGASIHAARMFLPDTYRDEDLERMNEEIDRCGELLAHAGADVVAYGCTGGSFFEGAGHAERIESQLRERAGVPAVATSASIERAFDALGLDSIAIATPYVETLNEHIETYLADGDVKVVALDGLGLETNQEIREVHPERVYRHARSVDRPEADGLFVSCTNYRTFDVIPALEADLDKPVVTSNQATLWDALRTAGVGHGELQLGALFEE